MLSTNHPAKMKYVTSGSLNIPELGLYIIYTRAYLHTFTLAYFVFFIWIKLFTSFYTHLFTNN